jgi:membrane-bound ClpP family serine protease
MDISNNINHQLLDSFVNGSLTFEDVEKQLQKLNYDNATYELHLKEYKKRALNKRISQAVLFMITGAAIGFISCLLTIFNPIPALYNFILYGLTSVAIIIAFIGLYLLFE